MLQKINEDSCDEDKAEVNIICFKPVNASYNKINFDGKNGGHFVWNDFGLEIIFPPECSQEHIQITINVFLPAGNEVYPGVHVVSAVYQFNTDIEQFDKPFTIRLQHCVELHSPEDCQCMCFVIYCGDNIQMKYGNFHIDDCYGTLDLSKIKFIFIQWIQGLRESDQIVPTQIVLSGYHSKTDSVKLASDSDSDSEGTSSGLCILGEFSEHDKNQQVSLVLSYLVDSSTCNVAKEEGEEKPIIPPPWVYEGMLVLPKYHYLLTKWTGVYSIYIKLAAWRIVSNYIHSIIASWNM